MLSRIIQYRVREREKVGPEHELPDQALIIISADNIDFLHSFSRVYCGEKKKSFHGTTIQAVQPIPSFKVSKCNPNCWPKKDQNYHLPYRNNTAAFNSVWMETEQQEAHF